MRVSHSRVMLSATDLANHLSCRHLTQLELRRASGDLQKPYRSDPGLEVLRQKGADHERAYLEHLAAQGLRVVHLPGEHRNVEATRRALVDGADAIAQAWLADGRWIGRADVLLRVPGESGLGGYHYAVVDTKLAKRTKPETVLQLCLYADLLAGIQDRRPDRVMVVPPGRGFEPETYRVDHYEAYYRRVKSRLEAAVGGNGAATYPEPCEHCRICDWWRTCDKQRHDDDHLSLVAGVSRGQRAELTGWGIETLARFGREPLSAELKPKRGRRESLDNVQRQAYVQLKDRTSQEPYYETIEVMAGRGLTRLPTPDPGDLFFDLEGDPFATEGGLEYLFGWAAVPETEDSGDPAYDHIWAHDQRTERAAFERFIDMVTARRQRHPGMHVYHYAPYEPAALKRLMGRYATHERQMDELLRGEVFVDLYRVTRQAVRAGVESYSIKQLERFFGYERGIDLQEVSRPKRQLEALLQTGHAAGTPPEIRAIVRGYNEDDCVSTWRLRQWLEERRAELIANGVEVPRPEPAGGEPGDELKAWQQALSELRQRLTTGVAPVAEGRDDEAQARWLLAHMLDWHWREEKAAWWEYYRLRDLPEEELYDEKAAIVGLVWRERLPKLGKERNPRYRYSYPAQIVEIRERAELYDAEGEKLGDVVGIDTSAMTVDIKQAGSRSEERPRCVYECTVVRTQKLRESLMRLGQWVVDNGLDAGDAGSFARAGRDLLLMLPPRRATTGPLRYEKDPTATACRLAGELDGSTLAIQGPPGSGKTHTGAHMIVELVRRSKRVGVSAVSHKVIDHLLQSAMAAAVGNGVDLRCLHKVSEKSAEPPTGVTETTSNEKPLRDLESGEVNVVGGTAWLWAREEYRESVDVLFVDEAGQMSLASVLAMSPCTRNIVLLGDPRQLEQPQKGSHPEGTNVSALQHVIGDGDVMPAEQGLFLEQTWRLHPEICEFTSRQFYDGRLTSRPGLEIQVVAGHTKYAGAGIRVEQVDHDGNQSTSEEEVTRVVEVVAELTREGASWTHHQGQTKRLRMDDIVIVAPYNAQVAALQRELGPRARVGTVDKFQGQEAAVVIYAMTTSSPEDAPRGMEFLYSLNRLNVATSRARCACVVVASSRLFEPECRSVRQMRLANGVCALPIEA